MEQAVWFRGANWSRLCFTHAMYYVNQGYRIDAYTNEESEDYADLCEMCQKDIDIQYYGRFGLGDK